MVLNQVKQFVSDAKKQVTTLKPTAKFVHDVLTAYVAPRLKELGLLDKANEIFKRKASDIISEEVERNDPYLVELNLAFRSLKSEILISLKSEAPNPKRDAVVINYFERLISNLNRPPVSRTALELS
jgi:hypothetical protein